MILFIQNSLLFVDIRSICFCLFVLLLSSSPSFAFQPPFLLRQQHHQHHHHSLTATNRINNLDIHQWRPNNKNNNHNHFITLYNSQINADNDNDDDFDTLGQQNRKWLMETYKLTGKQLNSKLEQYRFNATPTSTLRNRANFIQQRLDLKDEEMNRIIQRYPMTLKYYSETNVGPSLDCLETNLKLDKKSMKKLLIKDPWIFTSKVEDIEPKLLYLQNRLKLDRRQLFKIVQDNPVVLRHKLERVELIIDWIQQRLSLTDEQVSKIFPPFLSCSIEGNLEPTLEWIQQRLSLEDEQVSKIIYKLPAILGCSIEENLEPTLEWIQQRLSLSDTGLSNLVVTQPELLGCNVTKSLAPKIDFYIEAADVEEGVVIGLLGRTPRLIAAGIKRLNLRLEEAKEAGLTIDTGCLQRMAILSPERWDRSLDYQRRKFDKNGQKEEMW